MSSTLNGQVRQFPPLLKLGRPISSSSSSIYWGKLLRFQSVPSHYTSGGKFSHVKALIAPLLPSSVQSNISGYRLLKYAPTLSVAKKASSGDEGTRRNLSPNKYE